MGEIGDEARLVGATGHGNGHSNGLPAHLDYSDTLVSLLCVKPI